MRSFEGLKRRALAGVCTTALFGVCVPSNAVAQNAGSEGQDEASRGTVESRGDPEQSASSVPTEFTSSNSEGEISPVIIVTAQGRTEDIQDVPLSIATVSGEELEEFGIDSFTDFELPAVHIGQGERNDSLFIRGVGSGVNPGFEQSAPLYIDGTYFGRARAMNIGLFDAARVEVVKGPQPTYFGQNAIAGAISIVTNRPESTFSAELRASTEFNHNENAVAAHLSIPATPGLAFRIAAKYREMDGWMQNVSLNRREPQQEEIMTRASAVWELSPSVEFFAKYEYANSQWDGHMSQLALCPAGLPTAAGFDIGAEDCRFDLTRTAIIDPANHPNNEFRGASSYIHDSTLHNTQGRFDVDLGIATLTTITSYYDYDFDQPQYDVDTTPLPLGTIATFDKVSLFSQEVRLTSDELGPFNWIAGFYYDESDLVTGIDGEVANVLGPAGVAPTFSAELISRQDTHSWSVFGEVGYYVVPQIQVKLGGRYSEVEKSAEHRANLALSVPTPGGLIAVPLTQPPSPFPPSFQLSESVKDSEFQPAVTLEYHPNENVMFYVSWRHGFKAGGLAMDTIFPPPSGSLVFGPEKVDAYEAGARLSLWRDRIRLNATVFRADYDDLQVSNFSGTIGFVTTNAASSRSQGVELDGSVSLADGLGVGAALTYLDSEFTSFPNAPCYTGQPQPECSSPNSMIGTQDLSGRATTFAPKWSGTAYATYEFPLSDGWELMTRADLFFTSEYFTVGDLDPRGVQDGFAKVDARIGVKSVDGKYEVALVGRNLTDELTAQFIQDTLGNPGTYTALTDRPRQIAIQATFRY